MSAFRLVFLDHVSASWKEHDIETLRDLGGEVSKETENAFVVSVQKASKLMHVRAFLEDRDARGWCRFEEVAIG